MAYKHGLYKSCRTRIWIVLARSKDDDDDDDDDDDGSLKMYEMR